jgi:hypothetical protein
MLPFHVPVAQRLLQAPRRHPLPSVPQSVPSGENAVQSSFTSPQAHQSTLERVTVEQPRVDIVSRSRHASALSCMSPPTSSSVRSMDLPPLSVARSLMNLPHSSSSASRHHSIKRTPSSPVCLPLSTSFVSRRISLNQSSDLAEVAKNEGSLDWDDMDGSHHDASFYVHTEP